MLWYTYFIYYLIVLGMFLFHYKYNLHVPHGYTQIETSNYFLIRYLNLESYSVAMMLFIIWVFKGIHEFHWRLV